MLAEDRRRSRGPATVRAVVVTLDVGQQARGLERLRAGARRAAAPGGEHSPMPLPRPRWGSPGSPRNRPVSPTSRSPTSAPGPARRGATPGPLAGCRARCRAVEPGELAPAVQLRSASSARPGRRRMRARTVRLAARPEPLQAVLADRLQHREARLAVRRPRPAGSGSCPPARPRRPARSSPRSPSAGRRPPRPPPACSRRRRRPGGGTASAPRRSSRS